MMQKAASASFAVRLIQIARLKVAGCRSSAFNNAVTRHHQHAGMTMPDFKSQRLYQRVRPGTNAAKAQIITGAKQPVIACRLIDYSRGGACLEIFPMVAVPDRFELLHGGVRKKCRVAWRRGIRL